MARSTWSWSTWGILLVTHMGCAKSAPDDPAAGLVNQGSVAQVDGDTAAAIKHFTEALTRIPGHTDALRGRAACYLEQKKYDKAIEDLNSLISRDPQDIMALASRGRAHLANSSAQLALADFDAVLARQPDNATLLYFQAKAYEQLGDTERAGQDLEKARQIDPGIESRFSN